MLTSYTTNTETVIWWKHIDSLRLFMNYNWTTGRHVYNGIWLNVVDYVYACNCYLFQIIESNNHMKKYVKKCVLLFHCKVKQVLT